MFKFDFSKEITENEINDESKNNTQWFKSEEVIPENAILRGVTVNFTQCGEHNIRHISDRDIIKSLQTHSLVNNSVLNAEQNHSDLITAIYEGGLKIWECTFDLLNYINNESIDLTNKKVLDLGCGAGVLGIFSCLKGAAKTVFQDYNKEVIKSATIPNVSLNDISYNRCEFYCGGWESFLEIQKRLSENEKFDYILTSETIYNVNNYKKIITIFKHLLKKTGTMYPFCSYLAAKWHYFGVGGSIGQFEDSLNKENIFKHVTCWVCSDGVKRIILKITLK